MDLTLKFILIVVCILVLFAFAVVVFAVPCNKSASIETWRNYMSYPYGNIRTGSEDRNGSMSFYEIIKYKKPFDYPVTQLIDYPVLHQQNEDPQ